MNTKGTRALIVIAVLGLLLLALAPAAMAAKPIGQFDLEISKTDSADPVVPGQDFSYELVARNNGPSGAFEVWVIDTLPAEVEFRSAPSGCTYTPVSHTIECMIGSMLPSTEAIRNIGVTVKEGTSPGTFINHALVEDRFESETDLTNNEAEEPTTVPPASIGDRVWHDADRDGVQDPGEVGLTGVTVNLTGDATDSAVTGADGAYLFPGLAAGDYTVTVDVTTAPAGYTLTTAGSFTETLSAGEAHLTADFGLAPPAPRLGSIGDFVWLDADRDGVQDAGEAGVPGVTVTLSGPSGTATTTTAADGKYLFGSLPAGSYTATVTVPAGHVLTTAGSVTRALAAGENYLQADFGLAPIVIDLEVTKTVAPASVTVGEQSTFTITVLNKGPDPATGVVLVDTLPAGLTYVSSAGAGTYAAATGTWTVGSLAVGSSASRTITVTAASAGAFTNAAEVTAANQKDVDSVPGDGAGDDHDTAVLTATAVLASGQIGDTVYLDSNANKVQDSGEPGIAGAKVTLTGAGGATTTATTDANGKYLFAALEAGTYSVKVDTSSVSDDLSLTTAGTFNATIAEGGSYLDADFGFAEVLPKTGADLGLLTFAGWALIALGVVLLRRTAVAVRRR
jgi:uncharacterized repeat protein (TIGR01451 family)